MSEAINLNPVAFETALPLRMASSFAREESAGKAESVSLSFFLCLSLFGQSGGRREREKAFEGGRSLRRVSLSLSFHVVADRSRNKDKKSAFSLISISRASRFLYLPFRSPASRPSLWRLIQINHSKVLSRLTELKLPLLEPYTTVLSFRSERKSAKEEASLL